MILKDKFIYIYKNKMEQKRDYSKGKVYKIEPISEHDDGEIYIGSTIKEYLSQRMTKHRYSYGD